MDEQEELAQLRKFFTFVMSHGVISWAKASQEMGVSLSDFHVLYGERINQEMEKIYGWEDEAPKQE